MIILISKNRHRSILDWTLSLDQPGKPGTPIYLIVDNRFLVGKSKFITKAKKVLEKNIQK